MVGNNGEIQIEPGSIEEALLLLGELTARLEALSPGKDKQQGDSGYTGEAVKAYDLKMRIILEQLKTLVRATRQFLQKANNTFIEADVKSARGME